jgi:hypothetical protein
LKEEIEKKYKFKNFDKVRKMAIKKIRIKFDRKINLGRMK